MWANPNSTQKTFGEAKVLILFLFIFISTAVRHRFNRLSLNVADYIWILTNSSVTIDTRTEEIATVGRIDSNLSDASLN